MTGSNIRGSALPHTRGIKEGGSVGRKFALRVGPPFLNPSAHNWGWGLLSARGGAAAEPANASKLRIRTVLTMHVMCVF